MKTFVAETVKKIVENFRCFGGGQATRDNPIAMALIDQPASFAAGVDVKEVVEFILKEQPPAEIKYPATHQIELASSVAHNDGSFIEGATWAIEKIKSLNK